MCCHNYIRPLLNVIKSSPLTKALLWTTSGLEARKAGLVLLCTALSADVCNIKMSATLKGHHNCNNPSLHTRREMSEAKTTKIIGILLIHESLWMQWLLAFPAVFILEYLSWWVLHFHATLYSQLLYIQQILCRAHEGHHTSHLLPTYRELREVRTTGCCCWFIMSFLI